MAVYGSDLGSTYSEIFEKSLLFHEGKLDENGLPLKDKLLEPYDGCSRLEVYPEDFMGYEEALKQIEIAREICIRSEEQIKSERSGIHTFVTLKDAVYCERCYAIGILLSFYPVNIFFRAVFLI